MDDGITDCNDATVKILKLKNKSDVFKLHPAQLSPERQPDGRLSMEKSGEMDRIAREKGFHRFEWVHQNMKGETFPVQVTINAVTIDGKPALIAVWHDLSEIKKREDDLRRLNDKMKRDLEAASAIQKALLPVSSPLLRHLRTAWAYRPCEDLGGDILNIFALDERHVGLYVLDVTGHGLAASLMSVAASHFLSPHSESSFVRHTHHNGVHSFAEPSEVAERLNQHFSSHPEITQFFTMIYGVLDTTSQHFRYVTAGHPPPIHVNAAGARIAEGSGMPIGMMPGTTYSESILKLAPGDRLYLYSDGITEAKNGKRDLFGDERFMGLLTGASRAPLSDGLDRTVREVESWCRPDAPDDDITLLACELVP